MSWNEWEYSIPSNEALWETNSFHATNPFASDIEDWYRLSTQVEVAPPDTITNIFLDDEMADNVSNAEQNLRMAQANQSKSSQASPDSAKIANQTPINNNNNVWPPLNASVIATGDWTNSNREVATSSNINKWVENMNVGMTLGEITPHSVTNADLLGSGIPIFEASRNTLGNTANFPPESKLGKRKTRNEVALQNYTFATPPLLGPNTLRLECKATSQHSDACNVASPNSTITRDIKETEAIRKEFGHGMEQLKQVQTKLTKENSDQVQRSEVLMMEMDELRKEVKEIMLEGRVNRGKMEMTMATVKHLTERRISETTAIMAQRDKQADERLKCMSEMMHRRDLDVDKCMVDLMTTFQDFTLGVKTVAARVPNSPSPCEHAILKRTSNATINLSRSRPTPDGYQTQLFEATKTANTSNVQKGAR